MPNLHITAEVDIHARDSKVADLIVVELGAIGALHLEPDRAHELIDELQQALRSLAASESRQLHRDEAAIRSAAEFREDR